jgi:hypothetical protein
MSNKQHRWQRENNPQQIIVGLACFILFNAAFNNISVISSRSALLAEETRVTGENHQPVASNWRTK